MKLTFFESYEPREKAALWISLAVHICCAWFSIGYHYDDEHWQILEFANYKLGLSPTSDLPWEYREQIRPALQPFLVYGLGKALMAVKLYNPFILIFIFRFVSGILSWFAILLMVKSVRDIFTNRNNFYFFILFSSFLWFIPYVHVRYSSETWSGLFFFFGTYLLLKLVEPVDSKNWIIKSVLVGIFFGIAFWCRFQIVFAIAGLGLWLIFFKFHSFSKITPAILSGILLLAIGILIDHWFYNAWVFTPYNYFESNIIKNVAATFGVSPWWDYFSLFTIHAGIPLSLVLLGLIFLTALSHPKNPFVWILISFLLGHMVIGHKELRFLFPLIYLLPFCSLMFLTNEKMVKRLDFIPKRIIKTGKTVLIAFNLIPLLIVVFIKPPAESVLIYKYIYNHSEGKPVTLATLEKNPYRPGHLEANFYKPNSLRIIKIKKIKELDLLLDENRTVFFFHDKFQLPDSIASTGRFELLYRTVPDFAKKIDFSGWLSRANVWSIYRPEKSKNPD